MRLKDRSIAGHFYTYTVDGKQYEVRTDGSIDSLVAQVRTHMARNNFAIPENLGAWVEDQICSRMPPGKCFYESKAGDAVAKITHTAASLGDKAAKALGFTTNLEKKARGCSACQKRRERLNQLSK